MSFYSSAEMVALKRAPILKHHILFEFDLGYMEYLEGSEIWSSDLRQYIKPKTYVRTVDYANIACC